MAIHLTSLAQYSLLHVQLSGAVSSLEIKRRSLALYQQGLHVGLVRELVDTRRVTDFDFSFADMLVLQHGRAPYLQEPGQCVPVCWLVENQLTYGIARQYQEFSRDSPNRNIMIAWDEATAMAQLSIAEPFDHVVQSSPAVNILSEFTANDTLTA